MDGDIMVKGEYINYCGNKFGFLREKGEIYLCSLDDANENLKFPAEVNGVAVEHIIAPHPVMQRDVYKNIEIPPCVKSIGDGAFNGFTSAEHVSFGENSQLTEICPYAFNRCTNLKEMDLPDGVKSFGDGAMNDCPSIERFSFGKEFASVEGLMNAYYESGTSLKEIRLSPENEQFSLVDNCLVDMENGTIVMGCSKSVIPESEGIGYIGDCAFRKVRFENGLNKMPDNIREIGIEAFAGARGLKFTDFPENLTYTQYAAFEFSDIEHVKFFGSDLYGVAQNMFHGCKNLKSVDFSECEKFYSVGNSAFAECSELSEVTLPESLTTLSLFAFEESGVEKIKIPANCTDIGVAVFDGCGRLKEVDMKDTGVTELKNRTFADCTSLRSVLFPPGLKRMGSSVFCNCAALEKVKLPHVLNYIGQSCFEGAGLKGVFEWPVTVPGIYDSVLGECENLEGIKIPSGVKVISDYAFLDSGVKGRDFNINISKGVDFVNGKSFSFINGNINVYLKEDNTFVAYPKLGFEMRPESSLTFHVPDGGTLMMVPCELSRLTDDCWEATDDSIDPESEAGKIRSKFTVKTDSIEKVSVDKAIEDAKSVIEKAGKTEDGRKTEISEKEF